MHEHALGLFETRFGSRPTAVLTLVGDGSRRTYHRLLGAGGETAIAALGPDTEENRAFLSFSRAFREGGLPVPEIYGDDTQAGVWLMEDLGDTTLFSALEEARRGEPEFPTAMVDVYERVIEVLPRFQCEGRHLIDFDVAYPRAAFDRQSILWDLNYFKYHFLKLADVAFNETRLERDFHELATYLLDTDTEYFLYRDFQSRNVMLRDGAPWFIDYQGGRRGALHYDIASLLYDAKADLPDTIRERLFDRYLDLLEDYVEVDRVAFPERYRGYVIVRIMQAMGAYGYRGFFERKPRFLESVPYAARNLAAILERGLPTPLPEIEAAFARIVDRWARVPAGHDPDGPLTVHVHSFSYRRGYPEDAGGHGGGFVFDCRALPNPGRLEAYASLTGRDEPVADFLLQQPELASFWDHALGLVETQAETYRERGFTSLTVSFGCTGGQHRSVFLAERLADHLTRHHPELRVRILHREEPAWPRAPVADG